MNPPDRAGAERKDATSRSRTESDRMVTRAVFDWDQHGETTAKGAAPPVVLRGWGERIALKADRRIILLRTAEIEWIEAAGNYVNIHTKGTAYFVRETMSSIESKMPSDRFMRIHRSTIVNLDRIKELKAGSNGEYLVRMQNGEELTLSRGYRGQLQRLLG